MMMSYDRHPAVVTLSDIKQAALWFDRVLSHHVPHELLAKREFTNGFIVDFMDNLYKANSVNWASKIEFKSKVHEKVFYDITFGNTVCSQEQRQKLFNNYLSSVFLLEVGSLMHLYGLAKKSGSEQIDCVHCTKFPHCINLGERERLASAIVYDVNMDQRLFDPKLLSYLYAEEIEFVGLGGEPTGASFRRIYLDTLRSSGIIDSNPPVILPPGYASACDKESDNVTVVLGNFALVDTKKTSWEQIMEVRKDKDAIRKLRALRLFLYSTYKDKPAAFIEDDLSKRIDDYAQACRDHGLQTCLSALSATSGAKNLLAASAAGLSAAFLGSPLSGITTAALIELSNLTIEIAKGYLAFRKLKRDHEIAYIIEARKHIGSK